MKILTIDLHPGAGSQIRYDNVESWDWDEHGLSVILDNKTIVRFNPAYVIALVWQEIEDPEEESEEQSSLLQESMNLPGPEDIPDVKDYEDRL
jgi:hypothetical protein